MSCLYLRAFSVIGVLLAFAVTPATAQVSDTMPPQLVGITFSPSSVDVSAGPQTVTAFVTVSDDLSGVPLTCCPVSVSFISPSISQRVFEPGVFQSGDAYNSVWKVTLPFPQFAEAGNWKLEFVSLFDVVGNPGFVQTPELEARGIATDLQVTSIQDVAPPTLTSFSFTPAIIDTSDSAQNVLFTIGASDALAGIPTDCCPVELLVRSPSGGQIQNAVGIFDAAANLWRAQATFPRYSESGTWSFQHVRITDRIGNSAYFTSPDLEALGFPSHVVVNSVPSDTTPLQLTGLNFAPSVIDTATGPAVVTVVASIADDLSGVKSDCCPVQVVFQSPSGAQSQYAVLALDTGDPLNGIWRGQVTFPQYSESGTWKIYYVYLEDRANNVVALWTGDLEASDLPTRLVVIRPSLEIDGSVDPFLGGTVADETFGTRAQITFPSGVLTEPTQVAIDVFQEPLDVPLPQGFSAAGTRFVNISFTPQPAFPLLYPGLTVVLPLTASQAPGSELALYRLDPASGELTPALDTSGQPIVGTVDGPDGLSATFVGISRLSTIVGLRSVSTVTEVEIDVRPGSARNNLNRSGNGILPVAIFTTPAFDASTVDPSTVKLGGAGGRMTGPQQRVVASLEDVDSDGDYDLLLKIETADIANDAGAVDIVLVGQTFDGTNIEGHDTVLLRR